MSSPSNFFASWIAWSFPPDFAKVQVRCLCSLGPCVTCFANLRMKILAPWRDWQPTVAAYPYIYYSIYPYFYNPYTHFSLAVYTYEYVIHIYMCIYRYVYIHRGFTSSPAFSIFYVDIRFACILSDMAMATKTKLWKFMGSLPCMYQTLVQEAL